MEVANVMHIWCPHTHGASVHAQVDAKKAQPGLFITPQTSTDKRHFGNFS